jgi:ribokinase
MAIWNVGSVNIDLVYRVDHFVRPGETLGARAHDRFHGGKGANQSVALARAGAEVHHVGAVGPDGGGERDALEEAGVRIETLAEVTEATGHAVIEVNDEGENAIVIWGGANRAVPVNHLHTCLDWAGEGDIVLVQNETNLVAEALETAAKCNLRAVLNPAPATPELAKLPLQNLAALILNESEAQILCDADEATPPEAILERLGALAPRAEIVLTLGARGGWVRAEGAIAPFQAAPVSEVVDTTGAGDCFIGYYVAGMDAGLPVQERLARAARAAAIAVGRAGASSSIPAASEVDA